MNVETALPPRRLFTLRERRRNVQLEHVRNHWVVFLQSGLQQVHELKEDNAEMRWLADMLCPLSDQSGFIRVDSVEQRLSEWCAEHPEDARALVYLASLREDHALYEKAAAMGDSWAMAEMSSFSSCPRDKKFQLAWASAAKGDAKGTYRLMECFQMGIGCEQSETIADELTQRAAELGSFSAYRELLVDIVEMDEVQRVKLLASFFGSASSYNTNKLSPCLGIVVERYAADKSYGAVIFEVGEIFKGNVNTAEQEVFGLKQRPKDFHILARAVAMYDGWCVVAKEACVMWILVGKRMGFIKDIRKLIARMVWESRADFALSTRYDWYSRREGKCSLM